MRIDKIQPYQLVEIKHTEKRSSKRVSMKRSKLFESFSKDEQDYLIKKFNKKSDFKLGDNHE